MATEKPAAAPAASTTPPPEEKTFDPFVAGIVKSMKNVITPEQVLEKKTTTEPVMNDGIPLSERIEQRATATPADGKGKIADGKPADEKVTDKPAEKKVEAAPAAAVGQRPVIKVVKREPAPAVAAVAPAATAAPEKPEETARQADEEYVKTLTTEQQDQIAVARFAEQNGKKGIVQKYLGYFRAFDKFIEEHPELKPDSEELKEFAKENGPEWENHEYRRYERKMIERGAAETARQEARQEIEPLARELREIKVKPVIEAAVSTVEARMTTPDAENKELTPIRKAVLATIESEGYEAAVKRFPIEAPIIQGAKTAAESWLALRNGLTALDMNDATHQWLIGFVATEGRNMMSRPESERTVNGRKFVPVHEYQRIQREKPAEAGNYYTFSDEDIVEMIANKGLLDYNEQVAALRGAGYAIPEEKVSEVDQNGKAAGAAETVAATEATASPRAGSRAMPGPVETEAAANPNMEWLRKLHPDAEKILAGK